MRGLVEKKYVLNLQGAVDIRKNSSQVPGQEATAAAAADHAAVRSAGAAQRGAARPERRLGRPPSGGDPAQVLTLLRPQPSRV